MNNDSPNVETENSVICISIKLSSVNCSLVKKKNCRVALPDAIQETLANAQTVQSDAAKKGIIFKWSVASHGEHYGQCA